MTFVSPAQGRVTSHWGPRERHPVTGARGFHRGIDIAPPTPGQTGVPVYACYGGTVRAISRAANPRGNPITGTWNSGSYVLIDGPGGGSEWYGHLATIDVRPGQKVAAGDRLGTMGAVGNVTGIHLHLEMWDGRTSGGGAKGGNTRDPRIDFKRHGITPGSAPVLPKNPVSPLPRPDKTTPPSRDWFDMATKDDLRDVVAEYMTVELSDSAMSALATNQRVWMTSDLLAVMAHRAGLTFQWTGTLRDDSPKIKTALQEVQENSRLLPRIADKTDKTNHAVGRLEARANEETP